MKLWNQIYNQVYHANTNAKFISNKKNAVYKDFVGTVAMLVGAVGIWLVRLIELFLQKQLAVAIGVLFAIGTVYALKLEKMDKVREIHAIESIRIYVGRLVFYFAVVMFFGSLFLYGITLPMLIRV